MWLELPIVEVAHELSNLVHCERLKAVICFEYVPLVSCRVDDSQGWEVRYFYSTVIKKHLAMLSRAIRADKQDLTFEIMRSLFKDQVKVFCLSLVFRKQDNRRLSFLENHFGVLSAEVNKFGHCRLPCPQCYFLNICGTCVSNWRVIKVARNCDSRSWSTEF